ncbi:MAG: DUF4159 domain-containing protein [Phycisphaerales bacterium]|nr:DUF4159 domain-containing protein [Phycisphaerales bacterium]
MISAFSIRSSAVCCGVAAIIIAGVAASLPVRAADEDAAVGSSVTDAQVVESMHKAIDFLLKAKKGGGKDGGGGDNWEIQFGGDKRFALGETAIALYALLHAGQSLQDDPEYSAKVHWRSKEIAPVLEFIKKNELGGTYASGLMASALTLLPKAAYVSQGDDDGLARTLDECKYYVLGAMRKDGGYTYDGRSKFQETWQAYFEAVVKGGNKTETKKALDALVKNLYYSFGGPESEIQATIDGLRNRQKKTKDKLELARIDVELKELEKYVKEMPPPEDQSRTLDNNKNQLKQLEERKGNPAGLTNDATKKPMTKEELAQKIEALKATVKKLEDHQKDSWVVWGDLSNTQYGTLGGWALSDFGMELPDKYWIVQNKFWRKLQQPDGSWSYTVGNPTETRPTMGVAGLASLFIAQEFTDNELRLLPKPDKNIDAGIKWLTEQYTGDGNLYYMYGVERVGLSSGYKFFGSKDWYKIGATRIVKSQRPDGAWVGNWSPVVSTSYALLFLARGRNPVVFNKLQYNGPWNARTHDNAYITRWLGKRFEKPINWQVVNLQVKPEEWLDAPILLITGSTDPKFTKEDIEKLRWFVNNGGMIFSTADGGTKDGGNFTTAVKKYAGELVNKKYEMRQLPRNHELYSKDIGVDLPNALPLMGMSNGVRELWIHSTADVGADWQMRKFSSKNFELGAALYFYASGRASLKSKLQPTIIADTTTEPEKTIELARVDYPSNADPEPGAWPRLVRILRAQCKIQVNITSVPIASLDAKKNPIAHLTGTAKYAFTPADVQALTNYTEAGGLLFIDAAGGGGGGNTDFIESCRTLIKEMYPNESLARYSGSHPIFAGTMPGGAPITEVQFRTYGNLKLQRRVTTPAIDAIETKGRTRILFSAWDISSGFLGVNTWGIIGYAPATAEAIGRNILLYSLNPAAQ